MLQSPLRELFPPLLAAANGALALLDAPEKCGDPELAVSLYDKDVQMVLGLPLAPDAGAAAQGALCLMFDRRMPFSREQFACFASLAQLISLGLAMGELKRRNDELHGQLEQASGTDPLTGAGNARQGEFWLAREIGRARRYVVPLSLISFELDGFDDITARHGRPHAELALKALAEATQATLRGADALARVGAATFLVLAPHTEAPGAAAMAEKIRAAATAAQMPGGEGATISVGVAELRGEEDGGALLARLAGALEQARDGGRNRVQLAAP
ncbi:diguanylate cyclase (GGDEF)-like protein [Janthinobacterium sp. CG_23.3]|uniref:GGDEF domain-containing protein n=1 Tax=Janthinobacterium sp. CG_23.3 TaxID=3349634 RepID=UPI0038D3D6A2